MEKSINISKLDAAKRQLETAILLYFNNADPVSIHTLVGAAYGILSNLIESKGGKPLIKQMVETKIKKEYQNEITKKITLARAHFKHANKDPDFVLEFYPSYNDICLYDACIMYFALTSEKVIYLEIFTLWFQCIYQEYFNETPEYKKVFLDYKKTFGGNKRAFFTHALEMQSLLLT